MKKVVNYLNRTMNPYEARKIRLWEFLVFVAYLVFSGVMMGFCLAVGLK